VLVADDDEEPVVALLDETLKDEAETKLVDDDEPVDVDIEEVADTEVDEDVDVVVDVAVELDTGDDGFTGGVYLVES
jgi:hypothetical protein